MNTLKNNNTKVIYMDWANKYFVQNTDVHLIPPNK